MKKETANKWQDREGEWTEQYTSDAKDEKGAWRKKS